MKLNFLSKSLKYITGGKKSWREDFFLRDPNGFRNFKENVIKTRFTILAASLFGATVYTTNFAQLNNFKDFDIKIEQTETTSPIKLKHQNITPLKPLKSKTLLLKNNTIPDTLTTKKIDAKKIEIKEISEDKIQEKINQLYFKIENEYKQITGNKINPFDIDLKTYSQFKGELSQLNELARKRDKKTLFKVETSNKANDLEEIMTTTSNLVKKNIISNPTLDGPNNKLNNNTYLDLNGLKKFLEDKTYLLTDSTEIDEFKTETNLETIAKGYLRKEIFEHKKDTIRKEDFMDFLYDLKKNYNQSTFFERGRYFSESNLEATIGLNENEVKAGIKYLHDELGETVAYSKYLIDDMNSFQEEITSIYSENSTNINNMTKKIRERTGYDMSQTTAYNLIRQYVQKNQSFIAKKFFKAKNVSRAKPRTTKKLAKIALKVAKRHARK